MATRRSGGAGGRRNWTAGLADDLRRARNQYGESAEAEKRRLLATLEERPPKTASALLRAHDDLLFMRAFPGAPATLRRVEKLLGKCAAWTAALSRAERARLDDSGLAGSTTRHAFPLSVARWMTRRAPGEAEIDWRRFDDLSRLDRTLFSVLRPVELEAAESGEKTTRELFDAARRPDARSDLDWIVGALSAPGVDKAAADAAWNEAEIPVAWRLANSRWSTTANKLAGAPVVYRRSMRRPPADVAARIAEPMEVALLPRAKALKTIELARAALAARCREVLAISYPNPDEVYWCDLGEGAALAVIGVARDRRLSLETNTAYILVSNGVPIGYGGVTPFFRQANTGINIFDSFRGAETACLWVEMLRAFHAIYGVRRFVVNGYQFGEGNSEAINSGAYWFYYRLGFRPVGQARRNAAAREAERLARKGAAPSAKGTLRALARGDLVLELPGFDAQDALDETLLVKASFESSRRLAATPTDARDRAQALIAQRVAHLLGAGDKRDWPAAERRAFERLAPLVLVPAGAAEFPSEEKRRIADMLRAKGRLQERDFARAAGRCVTFYRALADALT